MNCLCSLQEHQSGIPAQDPTLLRRVVLRAAVCCTVIRSSCKLGPEHVAFALVLKNGSREDPVFRVIVPGALYHLKPGTHPARFLCAMLRYHLPVPDLQGRTFLFRPRLPVLRNGLSLILIGALCLVVDPRPVMPAVLADPEGMTEICFCFRHHACPQEGDAVGIHFVHRIVLILLIAEAVTHRCGLFPHRMRYDLPRTFPSVPLRCTGWPGSGRSMHGISSVVRTSLPPAPYEPHHPYGLPHGSPARFW